jgi:hypothetical protein
MRSFPSLAKRSPPGLSKLGREFEWRQTTKIHRWPCPRAPDLVIDMGAIAGKDFHQARIEVLLVACEPFSRSSLSGSPLVAADHSAFADGPHRLKPRHGLHPLFPIAVRCAGCDRAKMLDLGVLACAFTRPVNLLAPDLCKRREQSISALGTLLHCKGA